MKYVLVALISLIAGIFVAHYYSNFTTAMAVKLDRSIDQVFPLVAVETTVNVDDQPQKLLFYIRWRQNDAAGLGSEWAVDRDPATGSIDSDPYNR